MSVDTAVSSESAERRPLSIAYVIPRYGVEVIGGAESAARQFAERLALRGHAVTVLTTTARDSDTWSPHYASGSEMINGVSVHRFPIDSGRHSGFAAYAGRTLFAPWAATAAESSHFIELQGPVSQALIEAIAGCTSDVIAFYPYLFHPTVEGIKHATGRAVLHPAAHDEPAVYLPIFAEVFEQADLLIYHTDSEAEFVSDHFKVAATPAVTLGLGVDPPPSSINRSLLRRWSLENRRYALCLGRVDGHKGTSMLGSYYINYRNRSTTDLAMVFAGPTVVSPGEHSDLIVTGPVSEEEKWALIDGASFLVQPSYFESYSIVLFEAWSLGKPVLVNGACEVTRRHVERSGGGLVFSSYPSFEVALDLVLDDEALRNDLGERGRLYCNDVTWDKVLDRYVGELERYFRS